MGFFFSKTATSQRHEVFSEEMRCFAHELQRRLPGDVNSPQALRTLDTWIANAKETIKSYQDEEYRGAAILQRRRRLLDIQTASESHADEKPPSYVGRLPENDQSRKKLQDEIVDLTELYWESNRILMSKRERWDFSNGMLATVEIMNGYKDEHGRPWTWPIRRNYCADTGGCCGRDCGCCEKALISYIRTSENGVRQEVGVYDHCTTECPCCMRVRGCYYLHPELPQSEF